MPEPSGDAARWDVSEQPLVSVVVTTYTLARLNDVRDLLDSLKGQTYPNIEIVFVGEGPEELCESVSGYGQELGLANLKVLRNQGTPGLSPARNLGVQHSTGEIVAFVDDDAVTSSDWAARIVAAFSEHPEAIGVTGPAYPLWLGRGLRWWPEEFNWIISCPTPGWLGFNTVRPVRNAWGMNMAYRREAFALCQFSEAFIGGNQGETSGLKLGLLGDDTEFCARLFQQSRRPILFDPAVRVEHKVYSYRLTPRFVSRRAFWEGYTKATLRKRKLQQEFSLGPERALLRRIAFQFVPGLLWRLVTRPAIAWRQFRLAVTALSCVALGYAAGSFQRPLIGITRRFAV